MCDFVPILFYFQLTNSGGGGVSMPQVLVIVLNLTQVFNAFETLRAETSPQKTFLQQVQLK